MTIAVIPVKGRIPLLPYTINQALKVVDKVICITSEKYEWDYCRGAEVTHIRRTAPLGEKWNLGFFLAGHYDPDYVLFIGSSDWVSENWMAEMTKFDAEIVGVRGFDLLHLNYMTPEIDELTLERMCSKDTLHEVEVTLLGHKIRHWPGYTGERKGEPIGIGRVLNRDFLKKVGFKPFNDRMNHSMDYTMYKKADEVKLVEIKSRNLSISTTLWGNLHKFEGTEPLGKEVIARYFPYYKELTNWRKVKLTSRELWNVQRA